MRGDPIYEIVLTILRFVMGVIANRNLLKYVAMAIYVFLFAMFTLQPFSSTAQAFGNTSISPEQVVAQMKERLKLTDEQETKIRPIIEDNFKKQRELLNNCGQKSDIQQLQWATDMQIGRILTKEQMTEYEILREQEDKKSDRDGTQRKGRHGGMNRGF